MVCMLVSWIRRKRLDRFLINFSFCTSLGSALEPNLAYRNITKYFSNFQFELLTMLVISPK